MELHIRDVFKTYTNGVLRLREQPSRSYFAMVWVLTPSSAARI
jgi:hypothetical protein